MGNVKIVKSPPMSPPMELEKSMKDLKAIITAEVGDFIWVTPQQAKMVYDILAYACVQMGFALPE